VAGGRAAIAGPYASGRNPARIGRAPSRVLDERATGVRDAGSERTGGQIRNNAVKQGRLLEPSDFGEYAELFG